MILNAYLNRSPARLVLSLGEITPEMAAWLTTIRDKELHSLKLSVTVESFALLLEGKANLQGCGTVRMPSSEAINQAPAMIQERLLAIKSVDLRKEKIGFEIAGESCGPIFSRSNLRSPGGP